MMKGQEQIWTRRFELALLFQQRFTCFVVVLVTHSFETLAVYVGEPMPFAREMNPAHGQTFPSTG